MSNLIEVPKMIITAAEAKAKMDRMAEVVNNKGVLGMPDNVRMILASFIGGGHVIASGVPGTGKTIMMRTITQCVSAVFGRVTCVADARPSDLIGSPIYNRATMTFDNVYGPAVMTKGKYNNFLLADEMNRTPAKTQAALLELLEERQVTMNGETILMKLLFGFATINPVEEGGTGVYPLSEALIDRFACKLIFDYVAQKDARRVLRLLADCKFDQVSLITPVMDLAEFSEICQLGLQVAANANEGTIAYINNIVEATRPRRSVTQGRRGRKSEQPNPYFAEVHGDKAKKLSEAIQFGASLRAEEWLLRVAAGLAVLDGTGEITADHIQEAAFPVLRGRIIRTGGGYQEFSNDDIIDIVLDNVSPDRL
jgi:MoxR-like ATPase